MTITAYTDENFSSEYKSALELPINPDKVKFTKGIQYAEDKQLGSAEQGDRRVKDQKSSPWVTSPLMTEAQAPFVPSHGAPTYQ